MKLSLVISTWNSLDFLKPCLESFRELKIPDHEIIIVDSVSTDGTEEYLDNLSATQNQLKLKVLYSRTKLDWSQANQLGLDHARSGDWICLCNPDILFNRNFLKLLAYCEREQVEAIAPQLIHPDGRNQGPQNLMGPYEILARTHTAEFLNRILRGKSPNHTIQYSERNPFAIPHPVGSCFLVSRTILNHFEGRLWNQGYKIGVADSDCFKKLSQNNIPMILFPECRMIHYEGHRTGEPRWIEQDTSYGLVLYFRYWHQWPRLMTVLLTLEAISSFLIDLIVKTVKPRSRVSPKYRLWRIGQRLKGFWDAWNYQLSH